MRTPRGHWHRAVDSLVRSGDLAMDLPKIEGELAGVHLMHWPILVLGVMMLGVLFTLSVAPPSNHGLPVLSAALR